APVPLRADRWQLPRSGGVRRRAQGGGAAVKLGFVVGSGDEMDLGLLARLGGAALAGGHEVRVFLMHEAIALAGRAEVGALGEHGAGAIACGTNAARAGLDLAGTQTAEGSQLDHAALVRDCDRVVSLT